MCKSVRWFSRDRPVMYLVAVRAGTVYNIWPLATHGKPVLDEIKNYSCFVSRSTNRPAVTTLNGGEYAFGNTEEHLKHRVKGCRQRGCRSMGAFDHSNGAGFVARHDGDYRDAINNGKANVQLLVHEATLGGMSPDAARHLRYLGRAHRRR